MGTICKNPYSYTANNGTSIYISLPRFSAFATQFTAEKMPDGQLYISISASKDETTYTSPEIIVTGEGTPVENIFTVGDPLYNDLANSGITATLNFTWKRANGEEMKLTPANITFKKDTQYNITIKVNPYTDLGLSLSISEDPFYMEENYDINDGVITEITE